MDNDTMPDSPRLDKYESPIGKIPSINPVVNGRTPSPKAKMMVSSMMKGLGQGSVTGLRMEINRSLPHTSRALRDTTRASDEVSKLRQDFEKEINPTIHAAKQAMSRLLPNIKYLVPEKLYAEVEKKLQSNQIQEEQTSDRIIEDTRANAITQSLDEIFKAQQNESRLNLYTERTLSNIRHKASIGELKSMRRELIFQSEFMKGTYTAYLKKSLELKYKHLFVAKDTLASIGLLSRILEVKLEEIKHNTGLPDYAKLKLWESVFSSMRGKLSDTWGSYLNNWIMSASTNVRNLAMNKLKGGLDNLVMAGDSMATAIDMAKAKGQNPKDVIMQAGAGAGGKMLGMLLATSAGRKLFQKIRPTLRDADLDFDNLKTKFVLGADNLRDKWDKAGGIKSLFSAVLPKFNNTTQVRNKLLARGDEPAVYDNSARQSIVEIIPGYLAKQTKLMMDLVNHRRDNEEPVYDVTTRDFVPVSQLRKNILAHAFGDDKSKSSGVTRAVGQIKGAFAMNVNPDTSKLTKILPDVAKIIGNLAYHKLLVNPSLLKAYGEDDNFKDTTGYIDKATKGLKQPKVACYILALTLLKNNKIDKETLNAVNNSIIKQMGNDTYRFIMPDMMDTRGYYRYFKDMLDKDENLMQEHVVGAQTSFDPEHFENITDSTSRRYQQTSAMRDTMNKAVGAKLQKAGFGMGRLTPWMKKMSKFNIPGLNTVTNWFKDIGETVSDKAGLADDLVTKLGSLKSKVSGTPKPGSKHPSADEIDQLGSKYNKRMDTLIASISRIGKTDRTPKEELDESKHHIRSFSSRIKELYQSGSASIVDKYMTFRERTRVTQKPLVEKFDELIKTVKGQPLAAKGKSGDKPQNEALKFKLGKEKEPTTQAEYIAGIYKNLVAQNDYIQRRDALTFAQLSDITSILQVGLKTKGPLTVKALMTKLAGGIVKGASKLTDLYVSVYTKGLSAATSILGGGIKLGTKTIPAMFGAAGKLFGAVPSVIRSYMKFYGDVIKGTGSAIGGFFRGRDEPYFDVYIKDKVKPGRPILSRQQQEEGVVYASGRRVKRTSDITEPVFDRTTKDALITEWHLRRGLVNIDNKPIVTVSPRGSSMFGRSVANITSIGKSIVGFLTGAGGKTLDLYYSLVEKGLSLAHGGIKGAGAMIARMLGLDTGKIRNLDEVTSRMDTQIKLLKKIVYALGGDPSETTSVEAKHAKAKSGRGTKKGKAGEDGVDEEDKGFIGNLKDELKDSAKKKVLGKVAKTKLGKKALAVKRMMDKKSALGKVKAGGKLLSQGAKAGSRVASVGLQGAGRVGSSLLARGLGAGAASLSGIGLSGLAGAGVSGIGATLGSLAPLAGKALGVTSVAMTAKGIYDQLFANKADSNAYADDMSKRGFWGRMAETNPLNPMGQGRAIGAAGRAGFDIANEYAAIKQKNIAIDKSQSSLDAKRMQRLQEDGGNNSLLTKYSETTDPKQRDRLYNEYLADKQKKDQAYKEAIEQQEKDKIAALDKTDKLSKAMQNDRQQIKDASAEGKSKVDPIASMNKPNNVPLYPKDNIVSEPEIYDPNKSPSTDKVKDKTNEMAKLHSGLAATPEAITKIGEKQISATGEVVDAINALAAMLNPLVKNSAFLGDIKKTLADNPEDKTKDNSQAMNVFVNQERKQSVSVATINASKMRPAFN